MSEINVFLQTLMTRKRKFTGFSHQVFWCFNGKLVAQLMCSKKKKSSNELFACSQSLNTFLHHQRKKWSFPLRSFQANMKLRFVHHYYGYPSYEIAVCSPLLWISIIWNCGLFTIIMDILHMKLRFVHHYYGYPSWGFSVCPGHAGRSCDYLIHDKKWSIFKNEDSTFQKASFMKLQIWLWMNLSFVYYQ